MQHPYFHAKTLLFILFFVILGQFAIAQTDTLTPPFLEELIVQEVAGVAEQAPFVIPRHWKNGKPQCGRNNDKHYGYVLNDSILIPFEYEELDRDFSDFMLAKRGGLWGAINKKGEAVLPFVYKDLRLSKKGTLLAAQNYHKYGLISPANGVLVPLEFRSVIPLKDSVLIFSRPNKQMVVQVLSQQEVRVLDTFDYEQFERLGQDGTPLFSAQAKGGKTGIVDLDHRVLLPFEFDKIIWQRGNLINFETEKSFHGLVNYQNQVLVPAIYRAISPTQNPNLFSVSDERWKRGMIDSMGTIIVPMQYYGCWVLDNLECIKCNFAQGHFSLWDSKGKQFSREIYRDIHGDKAAPNVLLAQLPENQKWQILDRQGKLISRELVDNYSFFPFGFKCEKAGVAAIFDLSGKQVTDFAYQKAYRAFDTVEQAEKLARKLGLPEGTRLVCHATNSAGAQVYIDDTGKEYELKK